MDRDIEQSMARAWFENQAYFAGTFDLERADQLDNPNNNAIFEQTINWLNQYFAGEKPSIDQFPLNPQGTAFQQEVWFELRKVAYGETITYQELADRVAARQSKGRGSARAVGRNLISIIVPCHRVVGSNGDLTGYAGY